MAAGKLEFICADKIAADGTANLTFTHASDYVIAIDTEPMEGEPEIPSEPETPSESETPSEPETPPTPETGSDGTITSPGTGNDTWDPWCIIAAGAFVLLVGLGVFFEENKTRLQKSNKRK